ALVTINISAPANQPPVAVFDTFVLQASDTVLVLPVLVNDSDPDGDALTIISVTQPPVSGGTVAITDAGQTLTYFRQTTLPVTFSYTISDGQGHTATAQVTVSAAGAPNQPPTAANDTVFLIDGLVFNVLTNDGDPDGDPLTIIGLTQPIDTSGNPDGSVAITGAGQTVTFTPIGTVNIPATFTYTISDGRGGVSTAVVTILASP
uniref:Ig-like domain-containing protein n=1 Tax=Dokdonella sp. TaxID=2291710 RepID=UPI002C59FAE2